MNDHLNYCDAINKDKKEKFFLNNQRMNEWELRMNFITWLPIGFKCFVSYIFIHTFLSILTTKLYKLAGKTTPRFVFVVHDAAKCALAQFWWFKPYQNLSICTLSQTRPLRAWKTAAYLNRAAGEHEK